MDKQLDTHIKAIRSNRGGEYHSSEFIDHLVQNGILSQLIAPGMPQQNDVAERRNRTLLDMIRSMMSYSELPLFLWGYTLETAMYILFFGTLVNRSKRRYTNVQGTYPRIYNENNNKWQDTTPSPKADEKSIH